MVLKNEDINLLIKMENLIGHNGKYLFGEDGNKKHNVKYHNGNEIVIVKSIRRNGFKYAKTIK